MLEVLVLVVVSVVLWVAVAYAYWYSIKKTYAMQRDRWRTDENPDAGSHSKQDAP